MALQIPNFTYPDTAPAQLFERVATAAREADAAGFDAVFVMDHFYQLPMLGPPEAEMLEAYPLLGALAVATSRVRLGTLVSGRLSVAAGCLGVIEDCLIEAVEYAKSRVQHGKEIARHQLVQDHIAHIEIDRVASEAMVLRAAGKSFERTNTLYPNIHDGVEGMYFIQQCVASSREDGAWKPLAYKKARR